MASCFEIGRDAQSRDTGAVRRALIDPTSASAADLATVAMATVDIAPVVVVVVIVADAGVVVAVTFISLINSITIPAAIVTLEYSLPVDIDTTTTDTIPITSALCTCFVRTNAISLRA